MKKKKGFTLVELLVVIAILAILATVSVVGYLSFTNKAKQSADEAAVTQMNIALQVQEAIDKPDSYDEAKIVLEEAGFNIDGYIPLNAENIFYYDESEIRVLIYNQEQEKVTYPEELKNRYSSLAEGTIPNEWHILNDSMLEWKTIDDLANPNIAYANDAFKSALTNAKDYQSIRLTEDINLDSSYFNRTIDNSATNLNYYECYLSTNANGVANLDLNGHTITFKDSMRIGGFSGMYGNTDPKVANITLSNGKIKIENRLTLPVNNLNEIEESLSLSAFVIGENSSLTLNNIEFVDSYGYELDGEEKISTNVFEVADYGQLTINNSTIEDKDGDTCSVFIGGNMSETTINNSTLNSRAFGITTNAAGDQSWNVRLNVNNSTITTDNGSGVLVNVPGYYEFNDSKINGNGIGVAIRGGDATFENCTITESGDNTWLNTTYGVPSEISKDTTGSYVDGKWGTGDMIQYGSLIVGDWNENYYYDSSCKLINTSIYMNDSWSDLPVVYLSQDNGLTTTLTYDASCKFYKNNVIENDAIVINSMNESGVLPSGNIVVNK